MPAGTGLSVLEFPLAKFFSRNTWQQRYSLSFFHGAVINDLLDVMCATASRILVKCLWLAPSVDDTFDVLPEDRVEADDASVDGLVELEVVLLRTLPVHNMNLVVVKCL